jgi:hypothetical protein
MKMQLNKRGQFSIIAALLVAVILVATVMSTYAAIRYNSVDSQPQTLSSVDEVNQALRQLLGFTVGYYGSILQVTGNASYAQDLSRNYLNSGLQNIAEIRPENGLSFAWENLTLQVNWFGTESYSSGKLNVTYDLGGLGLYGLSYSPECRLDLQVYESASGSPASMSIVQNEQEPLNTLVKDNFKFYRYLDSDQAWELVTPPSDVEVTADGTYYIDAPAGVDSSCYTIQVKDARGVMVVGASFNGYASPLTWNSSYSDGDYVDIYNSTVSPPIDIGTHSNFAVQQATPGSIFDVLKEGVSSTTTTDFYPSSFTLRSSTTNPSGGLSDLQAERGGYMQFHSYPSAFGTSTFFGYDTKGGTASNFANVRGSKFTCITGGLASSITSYLTYSPATSTFGNTATGSSGQSIVDTIRGQRFTSPGSVTAAQSISAYLDLPLVTFGDGTAEGSYFSGSIEDYIRGSSFTCTDSGTLQSISAYIQCTTAAKNMKAAIYNEGTHTFIAETQQVNVGIATNWVTFTFASPPSVSAGSSYVLVVCSFSGSGSAYLYYTTFGGSNQGHSVSQTYGSWPGTASFAHNNYRYSIFATYVPQSHNVKAAIYDSSNNLVATSQENAVSSGGWVGFTFASPPTLAASTNYVLVVWAQSGVGTVNLEYSSSFGGNGRYNGRTYGSWPSSVAFTSDTNQYCIYCSYIPSVKAQAAIYSGSGGIIAVTEEKTLTTTNGWVTFNFPSQPILAASTEYVLEVWSSNPTNVNTYYNVGSVRYFQGSGTYPNWPGTVTDQGARTYSIYCTYTPITQYTAGVEFTGSSNILDWTQLVWKVNGTLTSAADVTLQLCNQVSGQYPTSGSGYASFTGATSTNGTWTISTNPANFRDSVSPGEWKLNVTAVSTSQFDMKLDLTRYTSTNAYYGLDLEEQWTNVNITRPNYDLCIKTGALASDPMMVDVWNNQTGSGYWSSLFNATTPLVQNTWNNVSVTQYVTSSTFTIRFRSNDTSDAQQASWNVSTVELRPQPDLGIILSQQDSTTAVEWLQNGTMRRLGQNLQLTSEERPIPPIPVRAIHLNQTFVNGTSKEVPFQVEDWASSYRIPLGMSSNETVFSNRQMIVFLMNTDVTEVTLWWNGSDIATQTPLAYTNTRFNDNIGSRTLNNGKMTLNFGSDFNPVTSTVGGVTTTANFMRINNEDSVYGAGLAYVIYNGVVRDIVQQEAEWSGGADGCPNLYANTVLTLPAGTSYYTYQLRLMFINSTGHSRTITDICPIRLSSSVSNLAQTENGTLGTSPVVVNGTGLFYNYAPAGNWTAHHWSQLINTATGAGSGIMFTDTQNQELYFFDTAGASHGATGALNVSSSARTIELAPVSPLHSVTSYTTPSGEDVTWQGAVVTFDGNTTPVYKRNADNSQSGLWILVEYQPRITVTPMV